MTSRGRVVRAERGIPRPCLGQGGRLPRWKAPRLWHDGEHRLPALPSWQEGETRAMFLQDLNNETAHF